MRKLVYGVAASLDGFIAGPQGEYDWITPDSGIDFQGIHSKFDTLLMGRRTYEVARTRPGVLSATGMRIMVASTTLDPARAPGATVVTENVSGAVAALKAEIGKDVWLMGGGVLFRSLVDFGLVDEMSVCVFPVMLGSGVPLLPAGVRVALKLAETKALPSGVVMLNYAVERAQ